MVYRQNAEHLDVGEAAVYSNVCALMGNIYQSLPTGTHLYFD
jgi:hypothetical protein